MRLLAYLLISALSIMNALAIGIGPAQVYRTYHADSVENISFTIINDEEKSLNFSITVRGESLLSCPKTAFTTVADTYTIVCTLTHPGELSPGPHYAEVVVSEIKPSEEGMITAIPASISNIRLEVPRPGTYAEGEMEIQSTGNHVIFSIYLYNFGTEAINRASADIHVAGTSLATDAKNIPSMSEASISAETTLTNGSYQATALVHYDGKNLTLEKEFEVGTRHLTIEAITIDPFTPGDIARIRIRLRNEWPEPVQAWAEVFVAEIAKTAPTETFTVEETKDVSAYVDTSGLAYGDYRAQANVFYDGRISSKDFTITLAKPKKPVITMTFVALILGLAVVIMALILRRIPKAPTEPSKRPRQK